MFRGEDVVIYTRTPSGQVDDFNQPIYTETSLTVSNVLVAPGPRTDLEGSLRPDGDRVVYTLHFPKTYKGSLRDTQIEVRGQRFSVIGDPKPYTLSNTPTFWYMPVEVEAILG